jgi:hypothetical protein
MVPEYPGGTGFGNTSMLLFEELPPVAVPLKETIPFAVEKNTSPV